RIERRLAYVRRAKRVDGDENDQRHDDAEPQRIFEGVLQIRIYVRVGRMRREIAVAHLVFAGKQNEDQQEYKSVPEPRKQIFYRLLFAGESYVDANDRQNNKGRGGDNNDLPGSRLVKRAVHFMPGVGKEARRHQYCKGERYEVVRPTEDELGP